MISNDGAPIYPEATPGPTEGHMKPAIGVILPGSMIVMIFINLKLLPTSPRVDKKGGSECSNQGKILHHPVLHALVRDPIVASRDEGRNPSPT